MASTTLKSSDGRDTFTIRNFRPDIPSEPIAKERTAFVKAATRAELPLDDDAFHAVARALTTIGQATDQIRTETLSVEHVGPATVHTIDGHVFLGELLPLFQPRGAGLYEADLFDTAGAMDHDENPLAMTTMTFRDETHLKAHVRTVTERTIDLGRDYTASILTKKIANPVLIEAVRIQFEDGTESFTSMAIRDGVSRVISAWKVIYPKADPFEFPDLIASHVLASSWMRDGNAASSRAKGRAAARQGLRVEAIRGLAGEVFGEFAIRVHQAFTVPAKIVVGAPAPVEDFEETMRELVAVSNGESRPWSREARDGDAMERALRRAVHDGQLGEHVQKLATGAAPGMAPTPLWRSVLLLAELMSGTTPRLLKKHLADLTGRGRITDATYARFLMPLIEAPWRIRKGMAVAAWVDGGPIPTGVDWDNWTPVVTGDFTELVPRALAGDADARVTLQVAGGIALAADRLLVGKSLEDAPFSADVPTVLDGLGLRAAGLWLLARAANAFQADRLALSALPTSKKSSLQAVDAYIVPKPSFREPELLLDANAGPWHHTSQPVPLTATDVVAFSDPHRGGMELDGPEAEAWRPSVGEVRDRVIANLIGALSALGDLDELLDAGDLKPAPLLGDEWERAHGIVSELQATVWRARPVQ